MCVCVCVCAGVCIFFILYINLYASPEKFQVTVTLTRSAWLSRKNELLKASVNLPVQV